MDESQPRQAGRRGWWLQIGIGVAILAAGMTVGSLIADRGDAASAGTGVEQPACECPAGTSTVYDGQGRVVKVECR